jgi:hypothetical protein
VTTKIGVSLCAWGLAGVVALLLWETRPTRADVLLPCPPKPENCLDCGPPPGMPPLEHPLFQSPCWANGPTDSPGSENPPSAEPKPPTDPSNSGEKR